MPQYTDTVDDTRQFVYSGDLLADAFLRENPFALLLGVIAHGREPERAWKLPFQLRNRLDHLYPSKLVCMHPRDLCDVIAREPALHSMPGWVANHFHRAANQVQIQYGQAERIWNDTRDADTIRARLRCIDGITRIKAEMMLKILVRDKFVFLDS